MAETTAAVRPAPLQLRSMTLDWSRPYLVGVVNVTPDSFSDGGCYAERETALRHAERLIADGADIIDIGGESTRPGCARPVGLDEELDRVVPLIAALAGRARVPISVDTSKAAVAEAACRAGAEIVNDIAGGLFDAEMFAAVERAGAAYVCGHVRGTTLDQVHAAIAEPSSPERVAAELCARLDAMPAPLRARTIVDPGLGFGKGTTDNLALLRASSELWRVTGCAVMVGPSRKRFLGDLTGREVAQRDPETVGACLAAVAAGAHLLRVHEVESARAALTVFCAVREEAA